MIQVGDYVVKTVEGVCRVADTVKMESYSAGTLRPYYLMVPVSDAQAKIYVPVSDSYTDIRPVMEAGEAERLIREAGRIESPGISDDRSRESVYKEAIRSGDPRKLMGIIKCMHTRKNERTRQGKKSTALDERYYRLAEHALLSELSFVLKKSGDEIRNEILASAGETG